MGLIGNLSSWAEEIKATTDQGRGQKRKRRQKYKDKLQPSAFIVDLSTPIQSGVFMSMVSVFFRLCLTEDSHDSATWRLTTTGHTFCLSASFLFWVIDKKNRLMAPVHRRPGYCVPLRALTIKLKKKVLRKSRIECQLVGNNCIVGAGM